MTMHCCRLPGEMHLLDDFMVSLAPQLSVLMDNYKGMRACVCVLRVQCYTRRRTPTHARRAGYSHVVLRAVRYHRGMAPHRWHVIGTSMIALALWPCLARLDVVVWVWLCGCGCGWVLGVWVPCVLSTQVLEWTGAQAFKSAPRAVWRVAPTDKDVAGYVRQVGNFTQVIVRDAGHIVRWLCRVYVLWGVLHSRHRRTLFLGACRSAGCCVGHDHSFRGRRALREPSEPCHRDWSYTRAVAAAAMCGVQEVRHSSQSFVNSESGSLQN